MQCYNAIRYSGTFMMSTNFTALLRSQNIIYGKIGNIHPLWFSSVTVKTFNITMHWADITLLLNLMFGINLNLISNVYSAWTFSVHCMKQVDSKSKWNFNPYNVFENVSSKLVSTNGTVKSNVLTVTDEKHKNVHKYTWNVYFQSCQLMFCSLD